MRVTSDMLGVEFSDHMGHKVVLWTSDGVPCTVDDGLTAEEAQGLVTAMRVALESWT